VFLSTGDEELDPICGIFSSGMVSEYIGVEGTATVVEVVDWTWCRDPGNL